MVALIFVLAAIHLLTHFPLQPSTGVGPVAFGCSWRDAEDFRCLFDCQAGEVSQFDKFGQLRIFCGEFDERVVEGSALRGQSAYRAACEGCHGVDGVGESAISLSNPWFLASAGDAFIRAAIAEGRPGTTMAAYEGLLPEETIDDLTALIRSWARPVDEEPLPPFEPQIAEINAVPPGELPDFPLREGRFVAAAEVKAAQEAGARIAIIDARPSADYLAEHIEGSYSLPFYSVAALAEQLPRDLYYVTYCGCPHAVSGQAADALLAAGFPRVAVLDEGFYFWRDQGWPTRPGRDP